MTAIEGPQAIVYCEGAFRTTNGKTAHGLVRRTERYRILSVVDSTSSGNDAGVLRRRSRRTKQIPRELMQDGRVNIRHGLPKS